MLRLLVPVALALGGVVAAALFAVGPAREDTAEYRWPPAVLPNPRPLRSWYSPLLLNQRPERINAQIPCGPVEPLPAARAPFTIFATALRPTTTDALAVIERSRLGAVVLMRGETVLLELPQRQRTPGCLLSLSMSATEWQVRTGSGVVLGAGEHDAAPSVHAVVTELDLQEVDLEVVITPRVQDTSASPRQTALGVGALGLLGLALTSVFWRRDQRATAQDSDTHTHGTEAPAALAGQDLEMSGAGPRRWLRQDVAVVAGLMAWLLIEPLFPDDGWVVARQTNFLASGGFSTYYERGAVNLPLVTWYEWLQHWVVAHTDSLAVQRLPSLAALAATWILVRKCCGLGGIDGTAVARWTSATVFLIGAAGFGITLRPEPVLSLLATIVLLCTIVFRRRESALPILVAALALGLAFTLHPAGLIAAAPVPWLIIPVLRYARTSVREATRLTVVLLSAVAATVLLAFLDSDTQHRFADARTFRVGAHDKGILDELERYRSLFDTGSYDPATRRLAVLLILAVIVTSLSLHLGRTIRLPIATGALGVSLLLIAPSPSKWIWHFGGMMGFLAVASATEATRLRRLGRSDAVRALAAIGAIALAVAVAWFRPRPFVAGIDVRTVPLDLWFGEWGVILALGSLLAIMALAQLRGASGRLSLDQLGRGASWAIVAAVVPVMTLSTAALVADAVATNSWTLTRQGLEAIGGRAGCGLADTIRMPWTSSMRPLRAVKSHSSSLEGRWMQLGRRAVGIWIAGAAPAETRIGVDWGRTDGESIRLIASGTVDLDRIQMRPGARPTWRFAAENVLPPRPPGANVVRLRGAAGGLTEIAVRGPVSYATRRLTRVLTEEEPVFVMPFVVPVFPCANQAEVAFGVGGAPRRLVDWAPAGWTQPDPSSPFGGIWWASPEVIQVTPTEPADIARDFVVYQTAADPSVDSAVSVDVFVR